MTEKPDRTQNILAKEESKALTVGEAAEIFSKMHKAMADFDQYRKLSFLTSMIDFTLHSVIVKPSRIHGKGVFARRDIKSGELITFYPADLMEYTPDKDRNKDKHKVAVLQSERLTTRFGNKFGSDQKNRDNDYAFTLSDEITITGHPSFEEGNYLGHLINDFGMCSDSARSIQMYNKLAPLRCNVVYRNFYDLHIGIVASKNIPAGSELLVQYGFTYWNTYHMKRMSIVLK